MSTKRQIARADRILPGLWRLRLPLPWPGVPHVNAWAISAGDGVVLVDTGLADPGALAQLELALQEPGLKLEHIRLLVCTTRTPTTTDWPVRSSTRPGCELWMHPNHAHMTRRTSTTPSGCSNGGSKSRGRVGAATRWSSPDVRAPGGVSHLGPTDSWSRTSTSCLGSRSRPTWAAGRSTRRPATRRRTSCLHQPDRGLLLSGDHLLGRISLYYDFGYTPIRPASSSSQPRPHRSPRQQLSAWRATRDRSAM